MRKIVLLGASALVLAVGIAGASAEPFNPTTNSYGTMTDHAYGYGRPMSEGRAAAVEGPLPFFSNPTPFYGSTYGYMEPSTPGSIVLQQFHEGK